MRHLAHNISDQWFKYILYNVVALLMLLSFSACIKDDLRNCNTTLLLQVKAINATEQDITVGGEAGSVRLYVFDQNQRLIQQMGVSADDIKNKTRIRLLVKGTNSFSVVAWSNLNGNQQVDSLTNGISMDQAFVQLKRNAEGFAINPDDLFYGILNIDNSNATSDITLEKDITIQRKTALVTIIVKGLDAQAANDYYFIIRGARKDTYNFKGDLLGDAIDYKQNGKFNVSNTQFISTPFRVYPLSADYNLTIFIYRRDNIVAVANINEDGSNIVPIAGVTTYVLIDLRASLNVNIVVKDWGEEYNWFEW